MRRLTHTTTRAAAALAATALAFTACGSDGDDAEPTSEPAADEAADDAAEAGATDAAEITIEGFAFSGATTAAPGATLVVTNNDGAAHTLTAADGEFNTGSLDGGASVELALPADPGTYAYFCTIHPTMTGEITIG